MIDNQKFIKATNFLKYERKIPLKRIAESIGINQGRIDNLRRNGVPMLVEEKMNLIDKYPEVLRFFTENLTETENDMGSKHAHNDTVHDAIYLYNDGRAWKELADTQKKLLEALELRIAKQEEELKELKAENRFLLGMVMELEKKTV